MTAPNLAAIEGKLRTLAIPCLGKPDDTIGKMCNQQSALATALLELLPVLRYESTDDDFYSCPFDCGAKELHVNKFLGNGNPLKHTDTCLVTRVTKILSEGM